MDVEITYETLKRRALYMRRNPTRSEKMLWRRLKCRKCGAAFSRQQVLFPFIVDFYSRASALCIEVDGECHDAETDARRDMFVRERYGVTTLRVRACDVERDADAVASRIRLFIAEWNTQAG
jgi:very-short-patch-repair endonuclease